MSAGKPATIYTVAREAGVSIATVSRVLGTQGRVAPGTRRRVEEAAARLEYTPLASARSLASKRHAALGLVVHADAAPEIITGFTAQATLREDAVMLVVTDGYHGTTGTAGTADIADTAELVTRLARRVDGLAIVAEPDLPTDLVTALASTRPVVTVARQPAPGAEAVLANEAEMAAEVTQHLLHHGRSRLVFVADRGDTWQLRERYRGVSREVRRTGACLLPPLAPGSDASDWIDDVAEADGFICADDLSAVALLAELRRRGMAVPADISVIGWADVPMSQHSWPSLTTVRPPFAELGRTAAGRLQERIRSGPPLDHPIVLPHTLVLRASCGCPHP